MELEQQKLHIWILWALYREGSCWGEEVSAFRPHKKALRFEGNRLAIILASYPRCSGRRQVTIRKKELRERVWIEGRNVRTEMERERVKGGGGGRK